MSPHRGPVSTPTNMAPTRFIGRSFRRNVRLKRKMEKGQTTDPSLRCRAAIAQRIQDDRLQSGPEWLVYFLPVARASSSEAPRVSPRVILTEARFLYASGNAGLK